MSMLHVHRSAPLGLAALLVLAACGGGSSGGDGAGIPSPRNLTYAEAPAVYPSQSAIAANAASWEGGAPTSFTANPPLPAGLTLDLTTGEISGATTSRLSPKRTYRITARNAGGSTFFDLEITVGVLEHLGAEFIADVLLEGLATPSRIAVAADGRIFFNELGTGDTRVLRADGTLQPTPFAHTDVATGGHQGLLGIVLHPDFASNRYVYVMPCTQGAGGLVDRIQVKRYVADESSPDTWTGEDETVIVDDLPLGSINNGGDLAFDQSTPPNLFVSIGDVNDDTTSQEAGGLAGRVLRYTETGAIPADNPFGPSDATWCLGLRNTFGIAVQPTTGDLWGADNGPAANDELNFLREGRNFEWGYTGPPLPPGTVGIQVTTWVDVIVPTALAWHTGAGWGADYADDLFLTSYDDEVIRRFQLSGLSFLDIDAEEEFAAFRADGIDNKPLDIERAPDGSLVVSTFTGIYRISKP